mmetsp:Transcript_11845/g.15485  ORF Transcript_11845/g.15485 Transcript_11845/m.15485 type:complete len:468 (-) Transcript_11845:190-1593(-)|eukprot:CAMPEP_0117737450 /NCGR_PEP_ID=MMETSP0947-20121206/2544_1 /TAXON_ID=44440 /ORGANISM="Chattonella subsalsa, Strain CCMP2191" /LENGTH=467 /DNA_ID=CAMNT_0005552957 /DNA_START=41 /DNA_END=1444 /DNA_ORIENTATION=+
MEFVDQGNAVQKGCCSKGTKNTAVSKPPDQSGEGNNMGGREQKSSGCCPKKKCAPRDDAKKKTDQKCCSGNKNCSDVNSTHQNVQDYYGKELSQTSDLKTNACCTADAMPEHLKVAAGLIHDEVMMKYYGCGLVVPELLEGCKVLDLGSGAGRDCYLISYMVGENGQVVGVDMTDEQLAVAQAHREYHANRFGHATPNTEFKKGYIEKLGELGLEPNSFDVIVSNCVINLSPDKDAVLKGAYDLLKPGGELYFSDVYADRRVPKELVDDPVLYGECLSGALYWNDFLRVAQRAGFSDPRLVTDNRITMNNQEIEERVGHIKFWSATYRLFKISELEDDAENFGDAVIYKGTVPNSMETFQLDNQNIFQAGREFPVSRNTLQMLTKSRYAPHFEVVREGEEHLGIFEGSGKTLPFKDLGEEYDLELARFLTSVNSQDNPLTKAELTDIIEKTVPGVDAASIASCAMRI